MRTTEERMARIRTRTADLKAAQRRQRRSAGALCTAACLIFIIGLGAQMPQLSGTLSGGSGVSVSGMASLIGDNAALGYILMGLLAFLLGVCCTLLLYRLRGRQNRADKNDENEDDDDEL